MNRLKNSNALRIVLLGVLLVVLLIPIFLVEDLVFERMERAQSAKAEMSSKWGDSQTISGPFLVVPYTTTMKTYDSNTAKNIIQEVTKEAYFLPTTLNVQSALESETRKRGIFSTILYQSSNRISGEFAKIAMSDFPQNAGKILWNDSKLVVSINDTKGIGQDLKLNWDGKKESFQPGTASMGFGSGIHLPISSGRSSLTQSDMKFDMEIIVNGSGSISFAPIGKSSKISIDSNWGDPSFIGYMLPTKRVVDKDKFSATWESSYFSRNYPQVIQDISQGYTDTIQTSSFGVNFFQQMDQYKMVNRSLKYAIIVILFSFTVFFLMEILSSLKLHPIQYGLIGSAMIVFYVLNLSLSEQMDFWIAYSIASFATSGLIGYYSGHILNNQKKGLGALGYFLFLYGFLYITLSAEDYALLLGSLALFVLLALVMYFTRKIDWYKDMNE